MSLAEVPAPVVQSGAPMRVAYFYFMRNEPARVRAAAPTHAAYWKGLGLAGYQGGPFADRSGGLIVFDCSSIDEAARVSRSDPFVQQDLVAARWVKPWSID
jgi:uncharacterized protein YciI